MKDFFRSLFGATGKEVNGVIILVTIFLIAMAYPAIHKITTPKMTKIDEADARILDSLVTILSVDQIPEKIDIEKFSFNPNSVTEAELARLGFSTQTTRQIINYRQAGGNFRIKSDLLKIYSIDSSLVYNLFSYIELPESLIQESNKAISNTTKPENPRLNDIVEVSERVVERFNLNLADTAMLQTVRGIGSVLSARIVSFRDKLGGFATINQLYEVYNLDSVVINDLLEISFVPESPAITPIRINQVAEDELSNHPYISRKQARLIIAYRNQHGSFESESDLLEVYLVNDSDIKRLRPYLNFEISE